MLKDFVGSIPNNCILYFYASWSSKCNLHIDALNNLAADNDDIDFIKINVTSYQSLKTKYSVKKIPTYVYIENDTIKGRVDGYIDQYSLRKWLKSLRS